MGPLVVKDNVSGYAVVGVNCSIVQGANLIDFAIPIERVVTLLNNFKRIRSTSKVMPHFDLGLETQTATKHLKEYLRVDDDVTGILVKGVSRKGDTYGAFQIGDFLTNINGMDVSDDGMVFCPRIGAKITHVSLFIL